MSNTMLNAALVYAKHGLPVFPIKPKTKNTCYRYPEYKGAPTIRYPDGNPYSWKGQASSDIDRVKRFWTEHPEANIGLVTGGGLIVIDLDEDKEKDKHGIESLKEWEKNNEPLPETVRVITGRGGCHLYYRTDRAQSNEVDIYNGVDIRGNGGYIIAAPSIHPNGNRYEFEAGYGIDEVEIAQANDAVWKFIADGIKPQKRNSKPVGQNQNIESGSRVATLVSIIGTLKNKGLNDDAIKAAIAEMNRTQCKPPLTEDELKKEVFPALGRGWGKGIHITARLKGASKAAILEFLKSINAEKKYSWNDKGNGELFADIFKDLLRWNVTAKQWFYYTGKIWKEDEGGMIAARYAKVLSGALGEYAFSIRDIDSGDDKYLKHVMCLGSLNTRKRMIEDARDKYCLSTNDFDKDLYLLNVDNCVLDLRKYPFKIIEHNPELLLSKICHVSYRPEIKSEVFNQFINEVMCGNQAKIRYLQKIHGYALTGDTREETCFIYFGATTRNGKSTLVETISYMMGQDEGYALNMAPETLALKQKKDTQRASGDIARLHNCRFLNASEPPKRMIFDVALLKTLLGRDRITARHLCQSEFEFIPCFKLVINTNYLPMITDDSLFTSGRINVITFDRHFEPEEQDKTLKDRLKEPDSMSGILNWCLEGLRLYYHEGLTPPAEVTEANEGYRADSDKIGKFIIDRLEEIEGINTKVKDVYSEYCRWCRDNGYGTENKGNFIAELKSKGMYSKSGTINGVTYQNVVCGYAISTDFVDVKDEENLPFND